MACCKVWTVCALSAVMGAAFASGIPAAFAQPEKGTKEAAKPAPPAGEPGTPPMDPDMQRWIEAATPGEEHKAFEKMVGTWNAKCEMHGPMEGMVAPGKMVTTAIHGGRFLHMEFSSDVGEPFTGSGDFGYNNVTKKYEQTWVDSMSTGIMVATGGYDAATKTWTMTAKLEDPNGGTLTHRQTTKWVSDDTHVFEIYHTKDGEAEQKVMTITYTRAK